jgi:glycosyltransferase involved in cell wall biosynthesis
MAEHALCTSTAPRQDARPVEPVPPNAPSSREPLRVVIVAEHASARFGGEAILPLHYFRRLRARGLEAWLVTHARTRAELDAALPEERERICYVPDTWLNRLLWRVGSLLPHGLDLVTATALGHIYTGLRQRRLVRGLVRAHGVHVVHQPIPVSAIEPSVMTRLGAPLVVGPLNGNMDWPPAFRHHEGLGARLALAAARIVAGFCNVVFPGKQRAAVVLVANERTRRGLPRGLRAQVGLMPENGVDTQLWRRERSGRPADGVTRFVFLGRLEIFKGVAYLLRALARVGAAARVHLEIIGDGRERPALERLRAELGLGERVTFVGWVTQEQAAARLAVADVMVMPSLRDCGGAVVLEGMASGLPVIATAWGGPLDYLDASCGIFVPPDDEETLVAGFAAAMLRLAGDHELRRRLGRAGRQRALAEFDWERKLDYMLAVYEAVRAGQPLPEPQPALAGAAPSP